MPNFYLGVVVLNSSLLAWSYPLNHLFHRGHSMSYNLALLSPIMTFSTFFWSNKSPGKPITEGIRFRHCPLTGDTAKDVWESTTVNVCREWREGSWNLDVPMDQAAVQLWEHEEHSEARRPADAEGPVLWAVLVKVFKSGHRGFHKVLEEIDGWNKLGQTSSMSKIVDELEVGEVLSGRTCAQYSGGPRFHP